MFDIITFGSATKDIFLQAKDNVILESENFFSGKGVCFSLGSKIEMKQIYFTSGGGGTNSAATFSRQGFQTAYCGKIGEDGAGENILKDLNYHKIDTSLLSFTSDRPTSHSVILNVPEQDRTILVYRGASELHTKEDIDFDKLNAKWFYLAPFSGEMNSLFYEIISHAKEKGIKVMANPGKSQLKEKRFREFLPFLDILLLNREEAALLTEVSSNNEEEMIKEIKNLTEAAILITKGPEGVLAYRAGRYYKAKPVDLSATDRTGAGDSFGSGFLTGFWEEGNMQEGIRFGIANSTSCLQKMGAKHGLLKKDDKFPEIPVNIL